MASRAMPRARLLLPVGLAAAAAGLSVLVSVVPTLPGEGAILEAVRRTEQPLLNEAMRSLDCLGSPWVIVATLFALAAVLLVRRRRWEAMACLLIIPMELMTLGLREVIDRPRPIPAGVDYHSRQARVFPAAQRSTPYYFSGSSRIFAIPTYGLGKLRLRPAGFVGPDHCGRKLFANLPRRPLADGRSWQLALWRIFSLGHRGRWIADSVEVALETADAGAAVEKRTFRIYNGLKC